MCINTNIQNLNYFVKTVYSNKVTAYNKIAI